MSLFTQLGQFLPNMLAQVGPEPIGQKSSESYREEARAMEAAIGCGGGKSATGPGPGKRSEFEKELNDGIAFALKEFRRLYLDTAATLANISFFK